MFVVDRGGACDLMLATDKGEGLEWGGGRGGGVH